MENQKWIYIESRLRSDRIVLSKRNNFSRIQLITCFSCFTCISSLPSLFVCTALFPVAFFLLFSGCTDAAPPPPSPLYPALMSLGRHEFAARKHAIFASSAFLHRPTSGVVNPGRFSFKRIENCVFVSGISRLETKLRIKLIKRMGRR